MERMRARAKGRDGESKEEIPNRSRGGAAKRRHQQTEDPRAGGMTLDSSRAGGQSEKTEV